MKKEWLFCAVLALVLLFSAQPATAAAEIWETLSTTITATCTLPTIKVTVPSTGQIYLNPLELTVSINGEDTDNQIISVPCCIANESDIPLGVNVTVAGAINENSDMTLATSSTKDSDSTDKSAFIYFEMQTANTADPNDVTWESEYDPLKHIIIDTTADGQSKENILTLSAMTPEGTVAEGGYAAFRLAGDAIKVPENNGWTSQDGITVAVAFTFTPLFYS